MRNLYFDEFLLEVDDNDTLKVKYESTSETGDMGDVDIEESEYIPLTIPPLEEKEINLAISELKKGKLKGLRLELLGSRLYQILFPDEINRIFEGAIKKINAHPDERGLRIIIAYTENSRIAGWPLETLHNPSNDLWLATDRRLSLCRKIGRKFRSFEKKPPLKILVVVSSPEKKAKVMSITVLENLMKWAKSASLESSTIGQLPGSRLKTLKEEVVEESAPIEVKVLGQIDNFLPVDSEATGIYLDCPAGYRKFVETIDTWKPQVLHFIGHGDVRAEEGRLAFVNPITKLAEWVTAKQFSQLVKPGSSLRLVVLQVCKSADLDIQLSLASRMVALNIPAVVAMQFEIENYCAVEFANRFYQALAQRKDVDYAVQLARFHITQVANPVTKRPLFWSNREFCTPVVYTIKPGTIVDTSPIDQQIPGGALSPWRGQQVSIDEMQNLDTASLAYYKTRSQVQKPPRKGRITD